MTTRLPSNTASAAAFSLALATPAFADGGAKNDFFDLTPVAGFVSDDGAAEHLLVTAKLMQLSQRIPAAACYEHFLIEKDQNAAFIGQGVILFDQILAGLENGDPALGLMKAETDPHVLKDLAKIHDIWDPLHDLLENIASGNSSDEDIVLLASKTKKLVDLTTQLMTDVTAEYADPTVLLMSDALQLDFAGRLPMMAQRMSKDLCMAMGGLMVDEVLAEMTETQGMFENTAAALRDGMPAMGIMAPKDPEIATAINEALTDWQKVAPAFAELAAGGSLTKETETEIFHAMNALTDQLDEVESMIAAASKMDL